MDDERYIREALDLADRGRGLVSPNPLVGALVVRGGEVVGRGWHEGPGTPHAEIAALTEAGDRARGATLYTSLEPCDHYGRTPPCTLAIARAGVTRVVAATVDPNPAVNGRGLARLRELGIAVTDGLLREEAERTNESFLKHVRTGVPFVTLKMAATLDGKAAARDGSSRWITGEEARLEAHRMRAAADAVMVGARTALVDDPSLTVRDVPYRGAPVLRVVVDSRGRLPRNAKVLSRDAPTLMATTEASPLDRREDWRARGAEVCVYEAKGGRVPLPTLLRDLGKRDVQHVLLEGGPTLAWSAVSAGVVDKVAVFLAASLLGGESAPTVLGGEGFAPVGDAVRLDIRSVDRVGDDLKVEAYVHRHR